MFNSWTEATFILEALAGTGHQYKCWQGVAAVFSHELVLEPALGIFFPGTSVLSSLDSPGSSLNKLLRLSAFKCFQLVVLRTLIE